MQLPSLHWNWLGKQGVAVVIVGTGVEGSVFAFVVTGGSVCLWFFDNAIERRNLFKCIGIQCPTRTMVLNLSKLPYALPSLLFTLHIFITLVKSVQTSHQPTRAQSKKTILKAWNFITIDFHQDMGQEFSTIVQIIVKADRGKAIAWRSVSCKMTCYYIPDVKTLQILSLHFVPTLQSAVYILYPVCSLLSTFCTNRYPWHKYSLFLVTFIRTTHIIYHKIPVCEVIRHFRSFPR